MNSKLTFFIVFPIVALFVLLLSVYTVDETEQVVVTRFNKVVRTTDQAGLHFKIPFIEQPVFYPKNLQEWDGDPGQIPTSDKTFIWVDTFARWKIVDSLLFFQRMKRIESATYQLNQIIDPAVRNFITQNRLIEAVRKSNRKLFLSEFDKNSPKEDQTLSMVIETGREKITKLIIEEAKPKLDEFGIELVDVKIKRINYVEEVQKSVYERMVSERKQMAEKFRSEGKGEASKIRGKKEKELKIITSEAYRTAQEIKGKADAQVTKILAEAFGKDPEFYSFIRTLEIYSDALDKDSSLVLSTDTEFFKYLKGFNPETIRINK